MAYRNRYLTVKLPEADWESIRDIANLQGQTLSTAGWNLIQRGIEGYEKEMGSSTPIQVQIHRLAEEIKGEATEEQRLKEAHALIMQRKEGPKRDKFLERIHKLAKKVGIDLT